MRLIVLFCLAISLVACAGEQAPDVLFDSARADVVPLRADGEQIGLVNTTHNVVLDYEHGYSRFGADNEVIWGPLDSFPAGELERCETEEAAVVGVSALRKSPECSCCYVRLDGTCGCYLCR